MYPDHFLQPKLQQRIDNGALRKLQLSVAQVDFCSNDYLGIVHHRLLSLAKPGDYANGATGSRLLSGNYPLIEILEKKLADFHQAAAALLFNSGYDANVGLLSSVPQKGDTILYDYLSHASIRDGIRLSFAQSWSFAHNDLQDLEKKLQSASGTIFIVTESVFSMDGDMCPLNELIALSKKFNAHLIIDEAHATGVIGKMGAGLVQDMGLQEHIFARIHTFGKACGCHGAVVLGSKQLRDYLINFSRSFMYSTALPEHAVAVINQAYELFPSMEQERTHLRQLVKQFQLALMPYEKLCTDTPIQAVMVPGNDAVKKLAAYLQEHGLDVRPILYPTVPKGKERLRIVLHAFNTREQLEQLITLLQQAVIR